MKRCVIISAVEIDFPAEKLIKDTDFVICADKGWQNAKEHGIKPDLIIGDFDSSPKPEDTNIPVMVLPVEKDDTDTYYVSRYIVENEFTDVLLLGALGGKRIEHTIANIQTLHYFAKNKINATAVNKYSQLTVIENGKIILPKMKDKYFSVFALDEKAKSVTIKGAKYLVDDYTITNYYPIGTSNEFKDDNIEISVEVGSLLIVITQKD